MIHKESLTAALLHMRKVDEGNAPAYASAVADVLIALIKPKLEEMHKQTALLEVLAKHADRSAATEVQINTWHAGRVTSGLPG